MTEENCHPFKYGRLLFQHNGHIEAFEKIKRRVMNALRDELYESIMGTTDSEACFALVLNEIDPALLASEEPIPPKVGNPPATFLGLVEPFDSGRADPNAT